MTYNIGFLDRIDAKKDGNGKLHFRIVDYKTGKIGRFIENYKIILVQHYVYMNFLKNEVKDSAAVDRFEFVFPFEKEKVAYKYKEDGTFERLGETPDCAKIIYDGEPTINDNVKKLIEAVKDNIAKGVYPRHSYSNKILDMSKCDDITYCPYKDICGICKEDGE